jgi:hypothetical protein
MRCPQKLHDAEELAVLARRERQSWFGRLTLSLLPHHWYWLNYQYSSHLRLRIVAFLRRGTRPS